MPSDGPWPTVGAFMAERFSHLDPEYLLARFDRGEIVALDGSALTRQTPLGVHDFVWYYREPPAEKAIPFDVEILHQDADLVVVDKPHFLPTTPGGKYLQNSALVRLRNALGIPELTPIHRLDRATAGLLMFSARPATRGAYQLLFERREVEKVYEAVSSCPPAGIPRPPPSSARRSRSCTAITSPSSAGRCGSRRIRRASRTPRPGSSCSGSTTVSCTPCCAPTRDACISCACTSPSSARGS